MENSYCRINNKRSCVIKCAAVFLLLIASVVTSGSAAYASSDAYDSGYDHGCDDTKLDPSERYINEPGKGPEFHTGTFMDGYNAGFNACSGGGSDGSPRDSNDGGGNEGRSRGDLIADLCNFAETNRIVAAGIALLLGYPGLDEAVRQLCTFR